MLNGGVPGYGLPDEVAWFEAYGLELEPDVVLVAVFLGNDILDATEPYRQIEFENGLIAEAGAITEGPRAWLFRHSHFVRLLKRAVPLGVQIRVRQALGLPAPWAMTFLRASLQVYARQPTELGLEGVAANRAAFERLHDLLQANEIPMVLMLVPDQREVDPKLWSRTLEGLNLDPESYSADETGNIFLRLSAEYGVPCLDLRPTFRDVLAQSKTPLYFRFDPHWTVAAHELAAQELERFLTSELE